MQRDESNIITTVFYGNDNLSEAQNINILKATANYLMLFVDFEENLYNYNFAKIYIKKEVANHYISAE